MTVTITITDPTATETSALCAYLTALHGGTASAPILPNGAFTYLENDMGTRLTDAAKRIPASDDDTGPEVTAEDAGAPDFDSAGMPWDERIHASSRATVADGTWRKKRGVSPEEVAAVEAELADRSSYDSDVTPEAVQQMREAAAPALEGVDLEQIDPPPAPVEEQSAPEVPDAPAPDSPPPPPAPTANPFLAVMSRIGKSKLDKAKKDELLTAAGALDEKGAPSILVLNKRPELIDGFIALLDSEGV